MTTKDHLIDLLHQLPGMGVDGSSVQLQVLTDEDGTRHARSSGFHPRKGEYCHVSGEKSLVTLDQFLAAPFCTSCFELVSTKGSWTDVSYMLDATEAILDATEVLTPSATDPVRQLRASFVREQTLRTLGLHLASGLPLSLKKRVVATRKELESTTITVTITDEQVVGMVRAGVDPERWSIPASRLNHLEGVTSLGWARGMREEPTTNLDAWLIERYSFIDVYGRGELLCAPHLVLLHLKERHDINSSIIELPERPSAKVLETLGVLVRDEPTRDLAEAHQMALAIERD